jgi:hypothetical protein
LTYKFFNFKIFSQRIGFRGAEIYGEILCDFKLSVPISILKFFLA